MQFRNYVGRLQQGPMKGLASGMLMDSWECVNQTWTQQMESEFQSRSGYALRSWMPALTGYVVDDQEATTRFLTDWRRNQSSLYNENFFKRMTDLAHNLGLDVQCHDGLGQALEKGDAPVGGNGLSLAHE